MSIRRTQTRNTTSGERYYAHRLVYSKRIDGKVKQITLLNLGRHFDGEQVHWPLLCSRVEELLGDSLSLAPGAARLPWMWTEWFCRGDRGNGAVGH